MLALTSATGKLGGAVLNAILENKLVEPENLVVCVSVDQSEYKQMHTNNLPLDLNKPF